MTSEGTGRGLQVIIRIFFKFDLLSEFELCVELSYFQKGGNEEFMQIHERDFNLLSFLLDSVVKSAVTKGPGRTLKVHLGLGPTVETLFRLLEEGGPSLEQKGTPRVLVISK